MIIEALTIKEKFLLLLYDSISRGDASDWATSLMDCSDKKDLFFLNIENEKKIWDAILFIDKYAEKISPEAYLYSKEDLKRYVESEDWI